MPRQLKFRAWDRRQREMVHVRDVCWAGDGLVLEVWGQDDTGSGAYIMPVGTFDLMQFTGLHDKRGREIYEGDIVGGFEIQGDPRNYPDKARVIFDAGAFSLDLGDYRPCLWEFGERTLKVLGNIHENPELLEEASCK